jgi:cytochrome oxidase Cu insertion factor (SCO1/SenC/PrrC family)
MNAWAVRGWILFAALLALLYGGWTAVRASRDAGDSQSTSLQTRNLESHPTSGPEPDRAVADFSLTDQSGRPFGSAELRGKVWIASFFFASCPAPSERVFVVDRDGRIRGRYSVLTNGSVDKPQVDKLVAFASELASENTAQPAEPGDKKPATDEKPAEAAEASTPSAQ